MTIVIGIIWGVLWAFSSYKLAMSKGRKSFAPFAAILGFLLGLIGFAIVACVRSTPEAKKRRADAKAAKAGLTPQGEHEAIPAAPPELQVPPGLHEEHNLPVQHSTDEHD
jgi:hypothetical protein